MLKKQYDIPELNIITFDMKDVITHSIATEDGDNDLDFGGTGWSLRPDGSITTPWGTIG